MFNFFEPAIDTGLIEYAEGEKLSVKGICKHSIYVAEDSDYAVLKFEDEEENCFKIKGNIKQMKAGNTYQIDGKVKTYNGEKQLSVISFIEAKPGSKKAIIAYLQTLPGLMSKAELIYDEFGVNSLDILDNDPYKLTEIKGIGRKSVEKWILEYQETKNKQYIIMALSDYGFSIKQCSELIKSYDSSILNKLKVNPYFLVHNEKGYGFVTCDRIAMKSGLDFNSDLRIQYGTEYILQNAADLGNVFLNIDEVLPKVKELLDLKLTNEEIKTIVDEKLFSIHKFNKDYELDLNEVRFCYYSGDEYILEEISLNRIKDVITRNTFPLLYFEENRLYLRKLYEAEIKFAEKIVEICKSQVQVFSREEVESVLDVICNNDNIVLEEKQREAVIQFNLYDTGVFILNGSAGTGKTFVLKLIFKVNAFLNKIYKRQYKSYLLPMAPTGKATKVMKNSLKIDCKTVHRGLEWMENGFNKNSKNPFFENLIVIDESSMLDIELAYKLSDAIRKDSKVIFIGDTKQLPSVGPGKVLSDLIESNIPIIVTLDIVKRQGEFSGIIRNANRIIFGEMIYTEPSTMDFFVENETNTEKIQKYICNTVEEYKLKNAELQVLIPQRTGPLGVNMLNNLIQSRVNVNIHTNKFHLKGKFTCDNKEFEIKLYEGDKVINTRNDYDIIWHTKKNGVYIPTDERGVTNGECGIIEALKFNDETKKYNIIVNVDDMYLIYEDSSNLELAYALTIHKSQGSQWAHILMPVVNMHNYILSNNLLYTGVTRATDSCFIIGQNNAIFNAINTYKEEDRNTTLKERLIEEASKYI